jgi:molecular chaperone GrpE
MNNDARTAHSHLRRSGEADEEPESKAPVPAAEPDAARVDDLELKLAQMRDLWMRSEAEVLNVRARGKRDVEEARQFAIQSFASDVVEMAENLQRGVASIPAKSEHEPEILNRLRDGFSGIEHGFIGLLERNGIKRQDPTGKAFDASLHQAMEQKVSADHPPGTVLHAWTSAWTLNGRLLRPAMVVVSAASPASPGARG